MARVEDSRFVITRHILTDFDSCISPKWAGDDVIYFAGRKLSGLQFIWSYNLKTAKLVQLTQPPIGARDFLSLSQNEKQIIFTGTGIHLEWRLWHISTDGTGIKPLTKGGTLSSHLSPVWIK